MLDIGVLKSENNVYALQTPATVRSSFITVNSNDTSADIAGSGSALVICNLDIRGPIIWSLLS
jgi:hypothetical protein